MGEGRNEKSQGSDVGDRSQPTATYKQTTATYNLQLKIGVTF